MKRLFLLEPVIALCAFSYFLNTPLMQQYVYRRFWLQLTNTSYPISDTSRCTANSSSSSSNSSNSYEDCFQDFNENPLPEVWNPWMPSNTVSSLEMLFYAFTAATFSCCLFVGLSDQEVQRQASLFSLYTDVLATVPSLVVILMLVAYSDRAGRKITIIMPLIGMLINTLAYLIVSCFELNIYLLIGSSILSALCGGLGTFLGGCFAYIADLCKTCRQKTLRMAGVDMMVGLLAGGASVSSGYFLKTAGFNWPFLTSSLILCLSLLYAIFVLEETMKPSTDAAVLVLSPQHSSIKQMVCGVYRMLTGASHSCKIALALLIIIFTSFSFAYIGGLSMMTLYELNEPLCWTEIFIGYAAALSSTVFLTSFVGVSVFTYCGVPQLLIVLLGILSLASGMVMVAFAKTTSLMFIAIASMLLSKMPFPVLRTMMSEIISKYEQGALFAFIYFLEVLTNTVSTGVFNSIYAGTVAWCPGFVFLLSAGLCVIPLSVIGVVVLMGVDFTKEAHVTTPLILEEENPVVGPSQNNP